jgi:hypothetical protein
MAKNKNATSDASAPPAAPTARKRTSARARPQGQNGDARNNPTHDEIAEAAYLRFLSRQGAGGSDFDDWLEAERDLRSRRASTTKSQ